MTGSITGQDNNSLAQSSDVLVLSIPYENTVDTCNKIAKDISSNCIIVTPIVPMSKTDSGFVYIPIEQKQKPGAEIVGDDSRPQSKSRFSISLYL